MKVKACIRSGYCCQQGVCSFGEWDEEAHQCKHLMGDSPGNFACGIYDWIVKQPFSDINPSFGTGCSSTIGNPNRREVLMKI